MSLEKWIWDRIQKGKKPYIPLNTNVNRDIPYHDYKKFTSTDDGKPYKVGQANVDAHGSQRKVFTSIKTLIYSDGACTIRFNHTSNVLIDILADVLYAFESNISTIIIGTIIADKTLYCYFEGVLPQESRNPK